MTAQPVPLPLPQTVSAWTYVVHHPRPDPPTRSVLTLNATFPPPPPPSGSNLSIRISSSSLSQAILPLGLHAFLRDRSIRGSIPELDFSGTVQIAGPAAAERYREGAKVWGTVSGHWWESLGSGVGGWGGMCRVAGIEGGNVEVVRGLGVDEVVEYRADDPLPAHLIAIYGGKSFDVILDTVGTQSLYEQCPAYLKPDGVYINVGAFEGVVWTTWCWAKNVLWPKFLGGTPRRYVMFSTMPDRAVTEKLAMMVEEGKLKVVVDSVVEMEDVLEAYDRLISKRARGKIIVKILRD